MRSLDYVMLPVWREVCRHLEISESTEALALLPGELIPLAKVSVRQIDAPRRRMRPVASFPALQAGDDGGDIHCEEAEWRRFDRWFRKGEPVHLAESGRKEDSIVLLLLGSTPPEDCYLAPLAGEHGSRGVMLAWADGAKPFTRQHLALLEEVREVLAVALDNDARLHELASLREAAEADRRSLLHRLGREEVGDTIVGESSGLRQVIERVGMVAPSDVPVLILGETGTGKELVARAIHNRSPRHDGPFIRVNCGAIPRELIDSQLFGHEKGAFTGATESRQGWFERADMGTLFLDEIGELPLDAQVRFLRVLQDGFVERVGGTKSIPVNVRVVAATHRDLSAMVRESTFREDLWYRIAVFPILLPPLRDRVEDIAALAHHFSERAAIRFGLSPVMPTAADMAILESYDWPGNIRELGAVIDRAAILGNGRSLELAAALGVASPRRPHVGGSVELGPAGHGAKKASETATLDEAMRQHIESALRATHGRIEGRFGAATLLNINPHTLRARMRRLGIDWQAFRHPPTIPNYGEH